MTKVNIIAEIGSVHDGSFGNALKLIELCSEIGVDTVKFQTHISEAETIKDAPSPSYFKGEPRFDYFNRTSFSKEQWKELKCLAHSKGLNFMSSPFSIEAVELLEEIGVDIYKIASGEVTNLPMLEKIAEIQKPIILSSGMSTWEELDNAVNTLKKGPGDLSIMQCSSAYPCPPEHVGLNILTEMKERYNIPVGFSDHTNGIAACLASVSLGSKSVEKHLTFSKKMYGSDAANATEPDEFAHMIKCIREIETMLNHPVNKNDVSNYTDMKNIFEKSIVVSQFIAKGQVIESQHLGIKKPGTGIAPENLNKIIGCEALKDLKPDHILDWNDVA